MVYTVLATMAAIVHGMFVVFVVAGGLLAMRWARVVWVHLPVAIYGVLIMVANWSCPLTRLEIHWREKAGENVQWTEFLQHYFFRYLGLSGSEWFVIAALVVVMVAINYYPYRAAISEGLRKWRAPVQ